MDFHRGRIALQTIESELKEVVPLLAVPAQEAADREVPLGTVVDRRRVRFQGGFLDHIVQVLAIDIRRGNALGICDRCCLHLGGRRARNSPPTVRLLGRVMAITASEVSKDHVGGRQPPPPQNSQAGAVYRQICRRSASPLRPPRADRLWTCCRAWEDPPFRSWRRPPPDCLAWVGESPNRWLKLGGQEAVRPMPESPECAELRFSPDCPP